MAMIGYGYGPREETRSVRFGSIPLNFVSHTPLDEVKYEIDLRQAPCLISFKHQGRGNIQCVVHERLSGCS